MKFSAIVLFVPLWVTFVYFPIAHMVWYWAGPAATVGAAKAWPLRRVMPRPLLRPLSTRHANAGIIFQWGAIDFAGGTVVHINAGIAGLVGAVILGKRVGFGREAMPPHSLTMCLIGTVCCGSAGSASTPARLSKLVARAALAMVNTFVATAAAALAWLLAEKVLKGKPACWAALLVLSLASSLVNPAAGFAGPMGAHLIGLVAGFVCLFFVTTVKNAIGYDDALEVFGVHCIGGIVGALGTAIVAAPSLGGTGVFDYAAGKIGDYNIATQLVNQGYAVAHPAVVGHRVGDPVLLVKLIVGLRPGIDQEREGLDLVDHGERAYNY